MRKLWHVWAAFALCLAIGVVGMAWLTVRAIDLDRAEAVARQAAERAHRQTELQERIAMALWRMDWMLTPLIAQEATRPSFVYRPFLKSLAGKGEQPVVASPLLTCPPNYVVLNFDVSATNGWNSPQSPSDADIPNAVAAGVSPEFMGGNRRKLEQLDSDVSFEKLLTLLPDTLLPSFNPLDIDNQTNAAARADSLANDNDHRQQQPDWSQDAQISQQAVPIQQLETPAQLRARPPNAQAAPQQQGAAVGYQSGGFQTQTREQQEWLRRNFNMQNAARSQRAQIMSNSVFVPDSEWEREGVSRPIWLESKLLLARRVVSNGDVRVQGCWLDWPKIKGRLQEEVVDLFPEIELRPVREDNTAPPGRLLATLPVQLVVPNEADDAPVTLAAGTVNLSAIRISLVIAWCCLLLGSVAIAVMLRNVLALSERRASFVSAVTHELRSPLTTFRMYAEMLAEGMVRDDQQRDRYLSTLRQEADRLSHLVDNVLQYARLERGRKSRRRVKIEMKELMQQTTERLPQRARQADMELHETLTPQDAKKGVLTDPAAVEQILFNLVDNSCKYASSAEDRRIHLHWSVGNRVAQVRVTDHGPGIQTAQASKLFHPFSKSDQEAAQSAPGIGLGLALCRRLARDIGGRLHFDPGDGEGAAFLLELPLA